MESPGQFGPKKQALNPLLQVGQIVLGIRALVFCNVKWQKALVKEGNQEPGRKAGPLKRKRNEFYPKP